jgi:hypothetical protein
MCDIENADMQRAKQLVQDSNRSHVTQEFLHRKLGISNKKAAVLVSDLIGAGVVGPREPSGHAVLAKQDSPIIAMSIAAPDRRPGGELSDLPVDPCRVPIEDAGVEAVSREISIHLISAASEVQVRRQLDDHTVVNYAGLMGLGHEFPPIRLFTQDGGGFVVADGHHRLSVIAAVILSVCSRVT